ncbi:MAG: efflux RND transporter periplasmic adaptor subunit [Candidatus Korobacteraceae bacterium]
MANGIADKAARSVSRNWAILAGVLAVVIAVSAFVSLRPRKIRIQIAKPERQAILSTITTNGKVEPQRNFEAHAPAATTVKRILVHEGDPARPGQLLVELDDSNARVDLAKATAQLRAAQANYAALRAGGSQEELLTREAGLTKARDEYQAANRNLQAVIRLQKEGAASEQEIVAARDRLNRAQADLQLLEQKVSRRFSRQDRERAQADLDNAEEAVSAARDVIERSNVRAPFASTVYSLPVRQGAYVKSGDLLVEVADLKQMQVRAFVDEPDIGRLLMGQAVKITWDALPDRAWSGKVTALPSNIVSHGSRMIGEVICALDNQDKKLLPNVNVAVLIVTGNTANALTLPREALHDEGNQRIVYVVRDGHLEERPVQTGVVNLNRVEIVKGLSENDTVAIASLSPSPLANGADVKIVGGPAGNQ